MGKYERKGGLLSIRVILIMNVQFFAQQKQGLKEMLRFSGYGVDETAIPGVVDVDRGR